jgi:hypothetical protein
MRYFKRYWDEPRGLDETSAWGCSWWFLEADEAGIVLRQVEKYDSGPTLRYSRTQPIGEFGFLTDQPLDLSEFAPFEIDRTAFEDAWGTGESFTAIHH